MGWSAERVVRQNTTAVSHLFLLPQIVRMLHTEYYWGGGGDLLLK